jgi:hypothetical protein
MKDINQGAQLKARIRGERRLVYCSGSANSSLCVRHMAKHLFCDGGAM